MNRLLRLAICAWPITGPKTLADFAAKLDAMLADAAAGGAALVLLPEYAAMELAAGMPGAGDVTRELAGVCAAAPAVLRLYREAASRHALWLQPGTLPFRENGIVTNRAPLISPNGGLAFQDKHVMTRFEAEQWGVCPGTPPAVFTTPWGRIGIAICYDVEFPALVRAQVEAGAWLILAPSCTDSLAGAHRVSLSARARALENQVFVAVSPTVGVAPGLGTLDENHGAAAVFGPVDRGFSPDGIVALGAMDTPGLVFADLDPARLEAVRAEGAVRNFRDWPAAVPACALRDLGRL